MVFRQLYDHESSTYTYLLAERMGGEALLIDPVKSNVDQYIQLVNELDLQLVMAVDTHIHADHVTGLGALRQSTDCASAMGEMTKADCVSLHFKEGEKLSVDNLHLDILYTPGHTDDSYSFLITHKPQPFSGGDKASAEYAKQQRATV
ncbi:MAG: MBL fold metallo-hydrolase, partial [Candidatus Thiodiazotropha endolucinida]